MSSGTVHLVGAGPGHPGLITLRGIECLRQADVVLYDYLANPRILCHARDDAELICLGRHKRADVWSQDLVNEELVKRASAGQCVVRLKGGDSMIFGRIAEELTALAAADIPFEIVPGVTSASAAGAYAGITITDRQHASAVAFVTGHERLGKPDSALDYQSLANFPGTLVIYMGVRTSATWSQALLAAGKPADTPVMLVRRCSWPDQLSVPTTLGEVAAQLNPYTNMRPPVVVIIGQVAQQQPAFDWFSKLPLLGQGIVISRPLHQADGMVSRLSELGANAILQPAIAISEPLDWQPVDDAIANLESFDFLVFSSANGVHRFFFRMLQRGTDVRRLANAKLAAVGPRTAATLREYSLFVDIQPATYRAEALAEELVTRAAGKRFLLLRASRGRDILANRIQDAGGFVDQVVVYRSDDVSELEDQVRERLEANEIHWITVTSSAIARSVCRLFGAHLANIKLASISPITSQVLRELGFPPTVEAETYTTDGVIDAIQRFNTAEQG